MSRWMVMCALMLTLGLNAQDGAPRVPAEFTLETPEDYKAHAALARKCMAWLTQHSLDEHADTREALNAFALLWLSGSPEIRVDISSDAIPCIREHDELFPVFIYGVALYQMNHPDETDTIALHAEGLRAVARASKETRSLRRCRCLRPLRKANRRDKLKELAREKLNA